jgi:hypothetical protein
MKPKRLNLYEMWELYRIDKENAQTPMRKSLSILYKGLRDQELSTNDKFTLYFNGISLNGYVEFQRFIDRITQHA